MLLQKIKDNAQGLETEHPIGNHPQKNLGKSQEERVKDAGESHGTPDKVDVVKSTSDTHPPSLPPASTAPDQEDSLMAGMLLSTSSQIPHVS